MSQKDDTISRQEAIDALGEEPEVWSGNDEYAQGLNNQWHYDVNALKAVPSVQAEQRWIPVTEKPIEKGLMLVTYNDGDVDLLKQPTSYRRSDIVAWMPLPEPWKGEQPC